MFLAYLIVMELPVVLPNIMILIKELLLKLGDNMLVQDDETFLNEGEIGDTFKGSDWLSFFRGDLPDEHTRVDYDTGYNY